MVFVRSITDSFGSTDESQANKRNIFGQAQAHISHKSLDGEKICTDISYV